MYKKHAVYSSFGPAMYDNNGSSLSVLITWAGLPGTIGTQCGSNRYHSLFFKITAPDLALQMYRKY